MGELFGEISPAFLMILVAGITEFAKNKWELVGSQVQLFALAPSLVLLGGYQVLQSDPLDAWAIFSAVVYTLAGWLMTIGGYEVIGKPAIARWNAFRTKKD